jgi:6-phosphogluconolactonase
MAMNAWLDHVPIPKTQIHSIAANLGADAATVEYAKVLAKVFIFDLVLLGLGEDGHTASLFPGHESGLEANAGPVIAVHDAPKPPPSRITQSAHRLSQAHNVFFMIAGESKQKAVRNWRAGEDIPARYITPVDGVDVYLSTEVA